MVKLLRRVVKKLHSSFETYMTLERTDEPGVICASGGAKTVWVNYERQKSVVLPDTLRRLIE